jgi:hypothetical protein
MDLPHKLPREEDASSCSLTWLVVSIACPLDLALESACKLGQGLVLNCCLSLNGCEMSQIMS